jgi:hypothetical protein
VETRTECGLLSVDFAQCAFGARFRKWTKVLFSARLEPAIGGWRHLGCAHGFARHASVASGRNAGGESLSAVAAAYPPAMNEAIAAAAEWSLAGFIAAPPAEAAGEGRVADGPELVAVIRAACEQAARVPARFSSFRNLRAASDVELRRALLPTLAPPSPPVPRRDFELHDSNSWPPCWEARRPIAIESLFREGVYAAL